MNKNTLLPQDGKVLIKAGVPGRLRPSVVLTRGVAVKHYKVQGWRKPIAKWILAREAEATAALARKGIAPITLCTSGLVRVPDRRLTLGTVWVEGQHPTSEVPDRVAKAILSTVEKIHKEGWTHNDLHRSNILFHEDEDGVRVWVLDWASAMRPIWPLGAYLRSRDRRHVEQMLGMRQGPKPLSSRVWRKIKSLLPSRR